MEPRFSCDEQAPAPCSAVPRAGVTRRILREEGLNPKGRRRVATTMSDYGGPIFPNLAKGFEVHEPNQL